MKVAVACDEKGGVSMHFGSCARFDVFDFKDGKLAGKESRLNSHEAGNGSHEHGGGHGGHAGILVALEGCEALLCGGMGGRAAHDLAGAGIKPMVIQGYTGTETAAQAYADGKITKSGPFHRCCHEK